MTNIIYTLLALALVVGIFSFIAFNPSPSLAPQACTEEAKVCPDGSTVSRTGPNCQFSPCPEVPSVPDDIQVHIDSKADVIVVSKPEPLTVIESPLSLAGEARGTWYFEASAPVVLVDWDGRIIAEKYITAEGDWMTTEFVPFTGELTFTSPYNEGDPDFMKRGAVIFQKDNPSGLPENDDALEIPILFSE